MGNDGDGYVDMGKAKIRVDVPDICLYNSENEEDVFFPHSSPSDNAGPKIFLSSFRIRRPRDFLSITKPDA